MQEKNYCQMCERIVKSVGVMRLINHEKGVHFDFEVCELCYHDFKRKAGVKEKMVSKWFSKKEESE